jgi:hypothetical protein
MLDRLRFDIVLRRDHEGVDRLRWRLVLVAVPIA